MDRILIAEDSLDFQEILVRVVRDHFPTVDIWVAHDGMDALKKFRTWDADAVITDMQMPKMNGEQLAARIREGDRNPNVPIILVSGAPNFVKDKSLFTGIYDKADVFEAVKSLQPKGLAN